jgi:methionine-rich copper-binding protein CopC
MTLIDPRDLANAAFLSDAAYETSAAALSAHLAGSYWQGGGEFFQFNKIGPFPGYPALTGGAFFAESNDHTTLGIAFRGSDTPYFDDYFYATLDQKDYYAQFSSFVSSIQTYLSNHPSVTKLLVTGHSLGGAMAEIYISKDAYAFENPTLITFGSPGVNANARGPLSVSNVASAVLHLQDTGDPVPWVGGSLQGPIAHIDLPDIKDGYLDAGRTDAEKHFVAPEHSLANYLDSANAIASSPLARYINGNFASYYFIRDTSDNNGTRLDGTDGKDFIIGHGVDDIWAGPGDDLIDAGDGDDTIHGGSGNDIIDGGSGTDTAVFELTQNQYQVSTQNNGGTVVITAIGSLAFEGTDTIKNVEKFQFSDGTFTAAQLLAQSLPPSDVTPPTLVSKSPADNSTGVAIATNIGLTFSESVFKGSGNIDIQKSDGSLFERIAITDTTQVTFSGSSVTINPSFDLTPGTSYYINIDPGAILDQAGNSYSGISNQTDFNFVTAVATDTSPPILSATSPADNANAVAAGANIGLTFNEIVIPGSSGTIDIHNSNGSIFKSISVLDSSQVTFSSNVVTINPNVDLVAGSDYYVTIGSDAIRDVAGNSFAGISSSTAFNFTTASAPSLPPPHDNSIFLSITDNSVLEGNSGTKTLSFGVNLTGAGAGTQTVSVQYATQDIAGAASPASAGQDYIATSNVLVIPAGQTSGHIDVTILGDTQLEPDEAFRLVLSQPSSNLTLLNSSGQASSSTFATGFITNDDQAPNHNPIAVSDIAITAPGATILMDVLSNDSDPDGDTLHISQLVSVGLGGTTPIAGNGTFSFSGGTVSVTPNAGVTGIFSLSYLLDDGKGGLANGYASVIVSGDGSAGITNAGSVGDDIIIGAGGNDVLSGGFGNDVIYGGPGSDRIDGGPGFDYLDLRQAAHGANIQFRDPWTWDDGDGGHDILSNIEGVLGTPFDDRIDGSSANIQYITTGYRFYGGDGNDRLQSDAGDDILDGGAGDDILIFGSGHDIVFGGTGNVMIKFIRSTETPTL